MLNRKHIFLVFPLIVVTLLVMLDKRGGNQTTTIAPSQELSQEAYGHARDNYIALVDAQDPRVALEVLRENTKGDDDLLRSCHAIAHEIGHEAFKKYSNFAKAIAYENPICLSGYMHGVIESYFLQNKGALPAIRGVCDEYATGSFLGAQCYHGAGHGLMYYSGNNLPQALSVCSAYKNRFEQYNCTNGVFMENFNTDQKIHPSAFLRNGDLYYPCKTLEKKYKENCYLNAPLHYLNVNKNDYTGALAWCARAEGSYELACAEGVGGETIKENINNPNLAEAICDNGPVALRKSCIDGMVFIYITHFGFLASAKELCAVLSSEDHILCQNAAAVYAASLSFAAP